MNSHFETGLRSEFVEGSANGDALALFALLQRHGICQLAVALDSIAPSPDGARLQATFRDALKSVLGEELAEPWSYLRSRDANTLRTLTTTLATELTRRASHG